MASSIEVSATLAMFLGQFQQYTAVDCLSDFTKTQILTHQSPYLAFTLRYMPSTMSSHLLD